MPNRFPPLRLCLLLCVPLVLGGCNSLGYYSQSVAGQWQLWRERQPIEQVLQDPHAAPELKARLRRVQAMRDFASRELALPDNGSYRSYADLGRPFVVWNVFAAPPLQMQLKTWCFPVAGCVGYRGYFREDAAQAYARELQNQGLETYVGGVAAYSTLGWFDDPLLNTVINRSEARIAGLIFHELAHQRVYVKGDTAFNEAFATTVELAGVQRWLARDDNPQQARAYARFQQRQEAFVALVTRTRDRLAALYAQQTSAADKQAGKRRVIDNMRREYAQLKMSWQGYRGYDAWFADPINNPKLAAVTTYRDHVPAFQALLAENHGDFGAFYQACDELAALPAAQRQAALARLRDARLASR